jgi:hypothetical protein
LFGELIAGSNLRLFNNVLTCCVALAYLIVSSKNAATPGNCDKMNHYTMITFDKKELMKLDASPRFTPNNLPNAGAPVK